MGKRKRFRRPHHHQTNHPNTRWLKSKQNDDSLDSEKKPNDHLIPESSSLYTPKLKSYNTLDFNPLNTPKTPQTLESLTTIQSLNIFQTANSVKTPRNQIAPITHKKLNVDNCNYGDICNSGDNCNSENNHNLANNFKSGDSNILLGNDKTVDTPLNFFTTPKTYRRIGINTRDVDKNNIQKVNNICNNSDNYNQCNIYNTPINKTKNLANQKIKTDSFNCTNLNFLFDDETSFDKHQIENDLYKNLSSSKTKSVDKIFTSNSSPCLIGATPSRRKRNSKQTNSFLKNHIGTQTLTNEICETPKMSQSDLLNLNFEENLLSLRKEAEDKLSYKTPYSEAVKTPKYSTADLKLSKILNITNLQDLDIQDRNSVFRKTVSFNEKIPSRKATFEENMTSLLNFTPKRQFMDDRRKCSSEQKSNVRKIINERKISRENLCIHEKQMTDERRIRKEGEISNNSVRNDGIANDSISNRNKSTERITNARKLSNNEKITIDEKIINEDEVTDRSKIKTDKNPQIEGNIQNYKVTIEGKFAKNLNVFSTPLNKTNGKSPNISASERSFFSPELYNLNPKSTPINSYPAKLNNTDLGKKHWKVREKKASSSILKQKNNSPIQHYKSPEKKENIFDVSLQEDNRIFGRIRKLYTRCTSKWLARISKMCSILGLEIRKGFSTIAGKLPSTTRQTTEELPCIKEDNSIIYKQTIERLETEIFTMKMKFEREIKEIREELKELKSPRAPSVAGPPLPPPPPPPLPTNLFPMASNLIIKFGPKKSSNKIESGKFVVTQEELLKRKDKLKKVSEKPLLFRNNTQPAIVTKEILSQVKLRKTSFSKSHTPLVDNPSDNLSLALSPCTSLTRMLTGVDTSVRRVKRLKKDRNSVDYTFRRGCMSSREREHDFNL